MSIDDLVPRLRMRAADPARRVDAPASGLGAAISSMGLGDLFGMAQGIVGDLAQVVEANQADRSIPPDLVARADRLEASMEEPAAQALPGPADPETLDRAEAVFGQALPEAFRRIYGEVADGGFGPGPGLFHVERIVATYRGLVADPPAPLGLEWPIDMVPLVHIDPGYYCLELPGGRIIDWDPESTSELQDTRGWMRSFQEIAPSLEVWLGDWVRSRTPAEEHAEATEEARREGMRRTRETIAAMTPAERAAVGLPEEGWEDAFVKDYD